MRLIKLGLISVVFFFLLITSFSLLIPSHVRISRAINIGITADSIVPVIGNVDRWKNWYPGFDTLPLLVHPVPGKVPEGEAGKTRIRITACTDTLVTAALSTGSQRPVMQHWQLLTHEGQDSTTVQWSTVFRLRWYPWEKFSSLLFEKRYGAQMEQGLASLKKWLEN